MIPLAFALFSHRTGRLPHASNAISCRRLAGWRWRRGIYRWPRETCTTAERRHWRFTPRYEITHFFAFRVPFVRPLFPFPMLSKGILVKRREYHWRGARKEPKGLSDAPLKNERQQIVTLRGNTRKTSKATQRDNTANSF